MSKTVVGIFDDNPSAQKATHQLNENGFNTENISIIAKPADNNVQESKINHKETWSNPNPKAINDNISDGVVSGTALGGVAGLLVGIGSVIIPGLGVIAAAGPIVGLLSGAVTGGIVGGLIDLGIPEEESKQYEKQIQQGKIFLSMECDDNNTSQVSNILKDCGATKVEVH